MPKIDLTDSEIILIISALLSLPKFVERQGEVDAALTKLFKAKLLNDKEKKGTPENG